MSTNEKPAPLLPAESPIVVVGAGVFGLSTAVHLLEHGYENVTVLERASEVPARDGAGYDLNKIIRSSYADPFYTTLAREAISYWRTDGWKGCYHECGVFVAVTPANPLYATSAYANDVASGAHVTPLRTPADVRAVFGAVPTAFDAAAALAAGDGTTLRGYVNHEGGWAEAGRALEVLLARVRALGGTVVGGKEVCGVQLAREGQEAVVTGVRCTDGSVYEAARVVVAAGAWTPRLMQQLGLEIKGDEGAPGSLVGVGTATGQTVATIQLTPEEAERYRKCPVALDFGTGFYIFPPNEDNVVKCAIHDNGYLHHPNPSEPSTPRTALSDGADGLRIPKEAVKALREALRQVYPELAEKPFASTRLCWYNDTADEDWVIGYHPSVRGLLLATAGNGHGYKFLPNFGRLVVAAMECKLPHDIAQRFAPQRFAHMHASSRVGPPSRPLKLEELCDDSDLGVDKPI